MSERPTILIVDDEPNIRRLLSGVLGDEGYRTESLTDAEALTRRLAGPAADLVLLDVCLPGASGTDWLKSTNSRVPVIMMSGHANIELALHAVRLGAVDFLEKPLGAERLLLSVANALERSRLSQENARLRRVTEGELLGDSRPMQELRDAIARVAPTDATVLISGESGSGKELVARALHRQSRRAHAALIQINCAAIPADLLESELFGHEKGAFSGADRSRKGRFELADGGTLVLDEIGDMPLALQAKLLRVLEDRSLTPLGAESARAVDVRLISSTHADLPAAIVRGEFREDLFHRLCVLPLRVPALREHREDLPVYVDQFLTDFCAATAREVLQLDAAALSWLQTREFRGNIRELRNLLQRVAILATGPVVSLAELQELSGEAQGPVQPSGRLAAALELLERQLIQDAVHTAEGNLAAAARELGVDRANLHRRMKRLDLDRS